MRTCRVQTSVLAGIFVVLTALAPTLWAGDAGAAPATAPATQPARPKPIRPAASRPTRPAAQPTSQKIELPADLPGALAHADALLQAAQYSTALDLVRAAIKEWGESPALQLRLAQALERVNGPIGAAEVRAVPAGQAGQFVGDWLLIEERQPAGQFLCCPRQSALYQLRQALDAGCNEPAAYVLHARIWQRLGRAQIGLNILQGQSTELLAHPTPEILAAFSDLALAAGELADYLRYERRRADLLPAQRDTILYNAYLAAADQYNNRGEDGLYVQWLQRAGELRPDNPRLLLRLGDAEWMHGDVEPARAHYRRLLRLEPTHPARERIMERLTYPPATGP